MKRNKKKIHRGAYNDCLEDSEEDLIKELIKYKEKLRMSYDINNLRNLRRTELSSQVKHYRMIFEKIYIV